MFVKSQKLHMKVRFIPLRDSYWINLVLENAVPQKERYYSEDFYV